jgi:hypothetical protein
MCAHCHVVTLEVRLTDLEALRRACARLGWALKQGQNTYRWYGRWMEDYDGQDAAFRHGVRPEDYGKCDHAIVVPGCAYEIGLIARGDGLQPIFDAWSADLLRACDGPTAPKLVQAYAVEKARLEARRQGRPCREIALEDGSIQLRVQLGGW